MTQSERRRGRVFRVLAALALSLVAIPRPVDAGGAVGEWPGPDGRGVLAQAPVTQALFYFAETGFGIDEPMFAEFFAQRGQVKTFGYPISRTFSFLGRPTQFFQRIVLQLGPDGAVRPMNLLDPGVLPYTRINGSTFPASDDRLAAAAPTPGQSDYGAAIVQFVRHNAPDTFEGERVNFFSTFATTVTEQDAFPRGRADPSLLPLINLEIWGVPTSAPTRDPSNGGFVYQRFQRGIMHYDAACRCTQGLLLADYLKALITGENLPPDLEEQARGSAFLHQFGIDGPNGVRRPAQLPDTDLRQAFARQEPPLALAPLPSAGGNAAAVPATGPLRTRMRVDRQLWDAVDALESTERLGSLNAVVDSGAEVGFGSLPEGVHARYMRTSQRATRASVRQIIVSTRWRAADPRALATIIAHEAKHLEEDVAGVEVRSFDACVQFEVRAFAEQSVIWQTFYGPSGKMPPQNELEEELNAWLAVYRRGPSELDRQVRELYARECVQGRPA